LTLVDKETQPLPPLALVWLTRSTLLQQTMAPDLWDAEVLFD